MNGWEQLLAITNEPKDIYDLAEYSSKEDVMLNSGWFGKQPSGLYGWSTQRPKGFCASGCQMAIHFGIHFEWLSKQRI